MFVVVHPLAAVVVHRDALVVVHRLGAVVPDVAGFVVVYGLAPVVAHPFVFVVLDLAQLVFLGVQPQLLLTLLVFKAQRVGVAHPALEAGARGAAGGGAAEQAAHAGVARQRPGRHVQRVVDAAGDDGAVGVAVLEVDDHFLPDARRGDAPEVAARPGLRDADPAAAVFVALAVAVPVELHFDLAVFVGVDLLPGRAGDDGGLGAGGEGFGLGLRAAEHVFGRLQLKAAVAAVALLARGVGAFLDLQRGAEHQPALVGLVLGVLLQGEGAPAFDAAQIARALGPVAVCTGLLHAGEAEVAPFVGLGVVAGPAVQLLLGVAGVARQGAALLQPRPRAGEVEVVAHPAPALQAFLGAELLAVFFGDLGAGSVVGHAGVHALAGRVGACIVHQDEAVFAAFMLPVVVQAPLLPQPAQKAQVGLAVLHLKHPARVAVGHPQLHRVGVVGQHLLGDADDVQVLKDAVVAGARGQGQPGLQGHLIQAAPVLRSQVARAGDQAVDLALATAVQLDLHAGLAAHHLFVGQVGTDVFAEVWAVGALQHDAVLEQLAQRLAPAQAVHFEGRAALEFKGHGRPVGDGAGHGDDPPCRRWVQRRHSRKARWGGVSALVSP